MTFITTGFARTMIAGVHSWRAPDAFTAPLDLSFRNSSASMDGGRLQCNSGYIYAAVGMASFMTVFAILNIIPATLASPNTAAKGRSWWEEQAVQQRGLVSRDLRVKMRACVMNWLLNTVFMFNTFHLRQCLFCNQSFHPR